MRLTLEQWDQRYAELRAAGIREPDYGGPLRRHVDAGDLRLLNLLEDTGGRVCGTEYLFSHALDQIPEHVPPMRALAKTALADPMAGSPADRADRICADVRRFGSEAVVISRIPGASHCAMEGMIIGDVVQERLRVPVLDIEVPPVADALEPTLRTRLEALVETVLQQRA
jgi:hypothetical protein